VKQAADGWVCEEKYDGWRMIAYKDDRTVHLVSRHGLDHTNIPRGSADGASGRTINKWESVA
jgi:ATP-dependent DNA ligase